MIGWIILAAIVVFLAVILIRAAMFKPKDNVKTEYEPVEFDRDAAVNALVELVRCRTVSYDDRTSD